MSHERICAKIDLSAACDNMESMHRNLFPDTRMIAVVKTNGYGHGAVPIAHRIESLPYLWGFALRPLRRPWNSGGRYTKPV